MSLPIADSPDRLAERMREMILDALPGANVEVAATSPGHFEIAVASELFAGKGLVDQQRLVYAAIQPLMAGAAPPVHAIDRLTTKTP